MSCVDLPLESFEWTSKFWTGVLMSGGLVHVFAGEWISTNIFLKPQETWGTVADGHAKALGLYAFLYGSALTRADLKDAKTRVRLGIGHGLVAFIMPKLWKHLRIPSRFLGVAHLASAALFLLGRPRQ